MFSKKDRQAGREAKSDLLAVQLRSVTARLTSCAVISLDCCKVQIYLKEFLHETKFPGVNAAHRVGRGNRILQREKNGTEYINDQINLDGNYCCEENMETHHSIPVHPLKQSQCHATTCEVYKSIDVF